MRRLSTAAIALLLTAPAWLAAQGQNPATEGFVPVQPGDLAKEQLPAAPLVFAAYAFVWLAVVVYVFSLSRRQARVERDMAEITATLARGRR